MIILILQIKNLMHVELNTLLKVKQLASSRTRILIKMPDTFKIGTLLKIFSSEKNMHLFRGSIPLSQN